MAIDRPAKSSVAAVLNVFAANMNKTDPLFGVVVRGIFHISSEIIVAAVDVPDRLMYSKQATAFYKVFGTGSNNRKKWEQMAVDTATRNWVYPVNPQLGVAASPEPPKAEPGFPGIVVRISLDKKVLQANTNGVPPQLKHFKPKEAVKGAAEYLTAFFEPRVRLVMGCSSSLLSIQPMTSCEVSAGVEWEKSFQRRSDGKGTPDFNS